MNDSKSEAVHYIFFSFIAFVVIGLLVGFLVLVPPEAQYKGNDNGSTDTGLCMINSIHGYDEKWLKVAENNLEAAYKVWSDSGYEAWSDYKNGRYLKFYGGK